MNHIVKKIALIGAMTGLMLLILAPSVLAFPIFGAPPGPTPSGGASSASPTDVEGVLNRVANWLRGILLAVAAVFIVVAAFMYVTAGGNSETIKTANMMILYTVAAIVIALLAQVIISVAQFFAKG